MNFNILSNKLVLILELVFTIKEDRQRQIQDRNRVGKLS